MDNSTRTAESRQERLEDELTLALSILSLTILYLFMRLIRLVIHVIDKHLEKSHQTADNSIEEYGLEDIGDSAPHLDSPSIYSIDYTPESRGNADLEGSVMDVQSQSCHNSADMIYLTMGRTGELGAPVILHDPPKLTSHSSV